MEYEDEIKHCLGNKNVQLILDAITSGKMAEDDVKMIAVKMKYTVNSVFEQSIRKSHKLDFIMKLLLDCWWNNFLHQPEVDAFKEFCDILEDPAVGQYALASSLKKNRNESGSSPVFEEERKQSRPAGSSAFAGKNMNVRGNVYNVTVDNSTISGSNNQELERIFQFSLFVVGVSVVIILVFHFVE